MVDASLPTLGYWKIRGIGAPIRYILEYLKVPFNNVMYEQGEGPEFSREEWYSVKHTLGFDFPNIPYFIDGDLKLTESSAIIRYIVNKWGPHLNGKTLEDQARIDEIYGIMSDIKQFASSNCYSTGDKQLINKNTMEKLVPVDK